MGLSLAGFLNCAIPRKTTYIEGMLNDGFSTFYRTTNFLGSETDVLETTQPDGYWIIKDENLDGKITDGNGDKVGFYRDGQEVSYGGYGEEREKPEYDTLMTANTKKISFIWAKPRTNPKEFFRADVFKRADELYQQRTRIIRSQK